MITKRNLLSSYYRNNSGLLILTFLFGFFNSIAGLAISFFTGKYYQLVFHTSSPRGELVDRLLMNISDLTVFLVAFTVLIVFKALFIFLEKYSAGKAGELFSKNLREQLFETQMMFSLETYDEKSPGKYLLRYSGDLSAVQRYVLNGVIRFGIDLVFLAAAFALLAMINFSLTLLLFGSFLFFFGMTFFINRKIRRVSVKRRNSRSELLAFVSSRLHGFLTVKIFNREIIEQKKFEKNSGMLYESGIHYYKTVAFVRSIYAVFLYGLLGGMFYYAYFLKTNYLVEFPAHQLIIFMMVFIMLLPAFRRILAVNMIWQNGNISFNKLLKILNNKPEQNTASSAIQIENGHIEFDSIHFSYPGATEIYHGLDLSIPENSITAICGAQGSGKSTLFKLLLGLYAPSAGEIRIDGQPIHKINPSGIRKNITLVSDETPLIGRTVFETISYSRKESKRESADRILQELGFSIDGVNETILDYPVKDGGKNLSGGQRKLLHLARALLTNKKIILLDEPFHGLDLKSKSVVCDMLLELKRDHTIVIATGDEMPLNLPDRVFELSSEQFSLMQNSR